MDAVDAWLLGVEPHNSPKNCGELGETKGISLNPSCWLSLVARLVACLPKLRLPPFSARSSLQPPHVGRMNKKDTKNISSIQLLYLNPPKRPTAASHFSSRARFPCPPVPLSCLDQGNMASQPWAAQHPGPASVPLCSGFTEVGIVEWELLKGASPFCDTISHIPASGNERIGCSHL